MRTFAACRLALLLAALGAAGQARAGLFDDDEARRQLADFKAKTESQFDTQSKALMELATQIQQQSEEIARLRGMLETQAYEQETTRKRQQDFYIDLDSRLRKLETAASHAEETAAKPPAADPNQEPLAYENALGLFKAAKYKDAAEAFAAFTLKYPDSNLAPNAQFWLGNAWYAQQDCKRAIDAQNVVVGKWPDHPKAADAQLAIATCQQELGNAAGAKRTLEVLVARYPTAPAAETARQRLKGKK